MKVLSSILLFTGLGGFCAASAIPTQHAVGDQRVTNGTNATQGQAPFLVRLKINVDGETRLCGGTIVDATTIISAAHCIRSPEDPYTLPAPRNTYVFYGSNLARNTNYVRATSLAVHPDWDWYTVENDISIIKIEPLTFVKGYVEPITIYSGQINPLDALQIYGWGVTVTGGTSANLPAKLQTSRIYVSKPADCQVIVYDYKSANGPQICANNHYNIGVDVCQGDSGTGTTIYANGQQYLAGLVSFGTDAEGDATCGEDGSFGVYTNVYYYLPWIESTLGYKLTPGPNSTLPSSATPISSTTPTPTSSAKPTPTSSAKQTYTPTATPSRTCFFFVCF